MRQPRDNMPERLKRLEYINRGLLLALTAMCAGTLFEAVRLHSISKPPSSHASIPAALSVTEQPTRPVLTKVAAHSVPSAPANHKYFHRIKAHTPHARPHRRRHFRRGNAYVLRYGPIVFGWHDDGDD